MHWIGYQLLAWQTHHIPDRAANGPGPSVAIKQDESWDCPAAADYLRCPSIKLLAITSCNQTCNRCFLLKPSICRNPLLSVEIKKSRHQVVPNINSPENVQSLRGRKSIYLSSIYFYIVCTCTLHRTMKMYPLL